MRPLAVAVMKHDAGNYRWAICALLFFATTVNYLNLQVLSLLAPALSKEFGRSNSDYAYVIAVAVWSLGVLMHAFAVPVGSVLVALGIGLPLSVAGFMVSRLVLTIGEAGNIPAAVKAMAEYFPETERSFATGIVNSGSTIGAILAPLTAPLIAATCGWPMAFVTTSVIGFLWIALWR